MYGYVQFLFCFCMFWTLSRCQGFQLEYLSSLVSEYEDCDVTFLILSPSLSLANLPKIPIRIYNYSDDSSVLSLRQELRKGQFQLSLFVFNPEFKFNGAEGDLEFEKLYTRYTKYISMNHDVFINVFIGTRNNLTFKPYIPDSKNHYLAIYDYREENERCGEKVYTISAIHVIINIPASSLVFNYANPIVRAILPYCLEAVGSSCRTEIKKKLSNILYGGTFYVDHFDATADLRQVYAGKAVNTTNYYKLTDMVRNHFKSPFKKILRKPGQRILICAVLSLEALDGWILKPNHKQEIFEWSLSKYFLTRGSIGLNLLTRVSQPYIIYGVQKGQNYLVVHLGYDYMNFITCDGVRQDMSFNSYTSPYDLASWLTIFGFSFVFLPLTVWILFQCRLQASISSNRHLNLISDIVFFNIAFGLDVGAELPTILKKKPRALQNANYILGLWIILLIVLVNAYKGIVTTELTAVSSVTSTHFNVTNMEGFTFFVSNEFFDILQDIEIRKTLFNFGTHVVDVPNLRGCLCNPDIPESVPLICGRESIYCNPLYSQCEQDTCEKINLKLKSIGMEKIRATASKSFCTYERGNQAISTRFQEYRNNKSSTFRSSSHYCGSMTAINQFKWRENSSLLLPFRKAFIYPVPGPERRGTLPGVSKSNVRKHFLDLTSKCTKTAYVDRESAVDTFRAFAESPDNGGLRYRKGNKFYTLRTGWALEYNFKLAPTLYKRMQLLVEFGIEQIWSRWDHIHHPTDSQIVMKEYLRKIVVPSVRPLGLKSNFPTIFYVFLILAGLVLIVFLVELIFMCSSSSYFGSDKVYPMN